MVILCQSSLVNDEVEHHVIGLIAIELSVHTKTGLMICRFPVCNVTYSLWCIWKLKINIQDVFLVIHGYVQFKKKSSRNTHTLAQLRSQGNTSCFSPQIINKDPFCGLFSVTFFIFSCFSLVISLAKVAPRHGAKALSSLPKPEKAVMCFRGNVCV